MDLELNGKVNLVTGGTDGLGAALATRLVDEGAFVAVCGRRQEPLDAMAEKLGERGIAVQADVTVAADMERFVDEAFQRWGRIDGVVNNAATGMAGPFEKRSDDEWLADLDLKVVAAVRLIRLSLPHLRSAPAGAIVNVLNSGATAPGTNSLPTSAPRAAGLALTKALSHELGPEGIRVNAIMIGTMATSQWERNAERRQVPVSEIFENMAKRVPLGRIGDPSEFGDLAAFLLSNRASYITGAAINLDGGRNPVP
ncbi:MAG: SDR family oxidoreductase [Candidatus Aminicenantes bacterium]|nr:SDR family oxidoreductase [Candidatus Aminicenantes bacterium]